MILEALTVFPTLCGACAAQILHSDWLKLRAREISANQSKGFQPRTRRGVWENLEALTVFPTLRGACAAQILHSDWLKLRAREISANQSKGFQPRTRRGVWENRKGFH
eukprot:sb/3477514/